MSQRDQREDLSSRVEDVVKRSTDMATFRINQSTIVTQARESSRWRKNVLQPYKNMAAKRKINRVESKNLKASHLVKYKGVSVHFLNEFWQDIRSKKRFPMVQLYRDRKTDSVVMWEKHLPNMTHGNYAICRKHASALQDDTQRILIKYLDKIERDDWTIDDLVNYCIYPFLAEEDDSASQSQAPPTYEAKTFLDTIPSKFVGRENEGIYMIYNSKNKMKNLISALQNYVSENNLHSLNTFVFLRFMGTDLDRLRVANFGKEEALTRTYTSLLKDGIHEAIQSFDERTIFIENLRKPKVLSRILNIWELYGIFEHDDLSRAIITVDYERIVEDLWKKEHENLFDIIENLDSSKIYFESDNERKAFLGKVRQFPRGMETIRKTLAKGFAQWAILEAEESVSVNLELKEENSYLELCELLNLAGNFTYRREDYKVAKSYFQQALDLYEEIKLEFYFDVTLPEKGCKSIKDDLDRPRHFTSSFIHSFYVGLITARLGYAKTSLELLHKDRAFELINTAKKNLERLKNDAPERLDLSVECDLALGYYWSQCKEHAKAVEVYSIAEVNWKPVPEKSWRVTKISYDIASEYLKINKVTQARASFENAYDRHLENLSEKQKEADSLLCDIAKGLGDCYNKLRDDAKAIDHYEKALKYVYIATGVCNIRVGRLQFMIGNCYGKLGMFELSLQRFANAIEVLAESQGEVTYEVALAYNSQAVGYGAIQDTENQEKCCRLALETARNVQDPPSFHRQHLMIATCCYSLAVFLKNAQRFEEADPFFEEALNIRLRELGPDHNDTKTARNGLQENKLLTPY